MKIIYNREMTPSLYDDNGTRVLPGQRVSFQYTTVFGKKFNVTGFIGGRIPDNREITPKYIKVGREIERFTNEVSDIRRIIPAESHK